VARPSDPLRNSSLWRRLRCPVKLDRRKDETRCSGPRCRAAKRWAPFRARSASALWLWTGAGAGMDDLPPRRPPTTGRPNPTSATNKAMSYHREFSRVHGDHSNRDKCTTRRRIIACRRSENWTRSRARASAATQLLATRRATSRHDDAIELFPDDDLAIACLGPRFFPGIALSRDAGLAQIRHIRCSGRVRRAASHDPTHLAGLSRP
jgi:hypothetical protein